MENMAIDFSDLFQGVYQGKKIFITGDTGFKGSWLATWLNAMGAIVYGYSLPPKTESDNYVVASLNKIIHHQDGDIRNYSFLSEQLQKVQPDFVFHLAAQPLVLESYNNPHDTFETNLMGTVNLLEAARKVSSIKVILNITSDKCYKNTEADFGYKETDPMGGKDPYSASKGCSELITSSYYNSFFNSDTNCRIASVRAGNVIGGGDWAENRIIPDFFRSIQSNQDLLIRNSNSVRPWQHVLEPLSGYLSTCAGLFDQSIKNGEAWNFGPNEENTVTVVELIEKMISFSGFGRYIIKNDSIKPYESKLLKLDISKAEEYLKWNPVLTLDETIEFTVTGYLAELQKKNVYQHRIEQITKYINLASIRNLDWAKHISIYSHMSIT